MKPKLLGFMTRLAAMTNNSPDMPTPPPSPVEMHQRSGGADQFYKRPKPNVSLPEKRGLR